VSYKKGLQDQLELVPPSFLGGLKTPEYLAKNPLVRVQRKDDVTHTGQLFVCDIVNVSTRIG